MKIRYQDAIVPAAAAVAVAIPRNPFRPICTLGTIAVGKMAADHLRRNQPGTQFVGIGFEEGDIPGIHGRPLELVNSAVTGVAIGTAWLLPTMIFRKFPKAVGPTIGALAALAAGVGARAGADVAGAKLAGAKPQNLGDLGLKDKSAQGGGCCGGQGGCRCGDKKAEDKAGCACGGHGDKADGCCGGHGKGKAEGGCGCGGHGQGGHGQGGHGHGHHGHGHHHGPQGHHGHDHGEPTATTSEAGLLGDAGYAGDDATASYAPGSGQSHPHDGGSESERAASLRKADGQGEEKSAEDALAETVAGQTTSPISGRSTMDPQS